jgi:hypothetical protein
MKATLYQKPDGRKTTIEITKILEDDANWFMENDAKISMEETGGDFVVYGDVGLIDSDGEPIEDIVIACGRSCEDTMAELRRLCQDSLKAGS